MPSPILGIDTSGSWCSVALVDGATTHARSAEVGNGHSDRLLAMVDEVLAEARLALTDCAAIAFSAGPGSFTGLRIGCAAAQGLAFGAGLRVAAIGTLEAIALASIGDEAPDGTTVLVAQDARMGEIYWSLMTFAGGWPRVAAGPALSAPATLHEVLATHPASIQVDIACGNAWSIHRDVLSATAARATRIVDTTAADAVEVARLGLVALRDGRLVGPEDAAPVYVRNDVARTTAERAAIARSKAVAA